MGAPKLSAHSFRRRSIRALGSRSPPWANGPLQRTLCKRQHLLRGGRSRRSLMSVPSYRGSWGSLRTNAETSAAPSGERSYHSRARKWWRVTQNRSKQLLIFDELLTALPWTDKTVVLMRFYLDMTVHEVGLALAISDQAVKSRTHRATSRLRRYLENEDKS